LQILFYFTDIQHHYPLPSHHFEETHVAPFNFQDIHGLQSGKYFKLQLKPLIVITLDLTKSDNTKRLITIIENL